MVVHKNTNQEKYYEASGTKVSFTTGKDACAEAHAGHNHEAVDHENVINTTDLGVCKSSSEQLDAKRHNTKKIDYLCKLDEAREWISVHTNTSPSLEVFYNELPKGEWLAAIAQRFDPSVKIFSAPTRDFRHTDNIVAFIKWLQNIHCSPHFYFETLDLYESKNIPKVIYCIHGLAQFLNKRGCASAIKRRKARTFTTQEEALVNDDASHFDYDNITDNLDSYEYSNSNCILNTDSIAVQEEQSFVESDFKCSADTSAINYNSSFFNNLDNDSMIKSFARTCVWQRAFNSLIYDGEISLNSLRKFLSYDMIYNAQDKQLQDVQTRIIYTFRNNYKLQKEKDSILKSVSLLLENQCKLRGMTYNAMPILNNFAHIKRLLYMFTHDYKTVYEILRNGYELPLRLFYTDTFIGDYHFSKLVEYALAAEGGKSYMAKKLACSHFISSAVFKCLVSHFALINESNFSLNPVSIYGELYKQTLSADDEIHSVNVLMDEAIKDEAVRREIVKRSHEVMRYTGEKLRLLLETEFPFYVKLFSGDSDFYENFIEPALILSKNHILVDLVKFIFNSGEAPIGQDRLCYSDSKFEKTADFEMSDYSVLRDFLENEENKLFRDLFMAKNKLFSDASEYFTQYILPGPANQNGTHENFYRTYTLNINIEEINNILIVLKENLHLLPAVMAVLVENTKLINKRPNKNVLGESFALLENEKYCEAVGIKIDGANTENKVKNEEYLIQEISAVNAVPVIATDDSYKYERFDLRLDAEFIDLNDAELMTSELVARDLKARLILMIFLSKGSEMTSVLHYTDEEEIERFRESIYPGEDLVELKRQTIADLVKFVDEGSPVDGFRFIMGDGYSSLLRMLAKEIIRHQKKSEELIMNLDTLDSLFETNQLLKDDIECAYEYLNGLFSTMVLNKSGTIFNRQAYPKSEFGTYEFNANAFDAVMADGVDSENITIRISMDEYLVLNIVAMYSSKKMSEDLLVRFDELLRIREDNIFTLNINNVCSLNISKLIDTINDKYINY
ncbi:hypothetical protein ENBRE01_0394 [Enteropsectra breve]|nr:hypothetical protein ENBRE01_0394 [Enteropsectra breve]